jgi:hypothetical protein
VDVFQYMQQNGRNFFATSVTNKAEKPESEIWPEQEKKDHLTGKIVGQPVINPKEENIMDTGEGRFEAMKDLSIEDEMRKKYPKSKGVFTVGEKIEIRGSLFKIKDIYPWGMKLKLLPEEE